MAYLVRVVFQASSTCRRTASSASSNRGLGSTRRCTLRCACKIECKMTQRQQPWGCQGMLLVFCRVALKTMSRCIYVVANPGKLLQALTEAIVSQPTNIPRTTRFLSERGTEYVRPEAASYAGWQCLTCESGVRYTASFPAAFFYASLASWVNKTDNRRRAAGVLTSCLRYSRKIFKRLLNVKITFSTFEQLSKLKYKFPCFGSKRGRISIQRVICLRICILFF
jgi:hypothetical protein